MRAVFLFFAPQKYLYTKLMVYEMPHESDCDIQKKSVPLQTEIIN